MAYITEKKPFNWPASCKNIADKEVGSSEKQGRANRKWCATLRKFPNNDIQLNAAQVTKNLVTPSSKPENNGVKIYTFNLDENTFFSSK